MKATDIDWFVESTRDSHAVRRGSKEWIRIASEFKRLEANGYSGDDILFAIRTMIANGYPPEYPYQVLWNVPRGGGVKWIDFSKIDPPPLWDELNFQMWKEGRMPPKVL